MDSKKDISRLIVITPKVQGTVFVTRSSYGNSAIKSAVRPPLKVQPSPPRVQPPGVQLVDWKTGSARVHVTSRRPSPKSSVPQPPTVQELRAGRSWIRHRTIGSPLGMTFTRYCLIVALVRAMGLNAQIGFASGLDLIPYAEATRLDEVTNGMLFHDA